VVGGFLTAPPAGATDSPERQGVVYVKGARFVDALLERWVAEYAREYPEAALRVGEATEVESLIVVAPLGKPNDSTLLAESTVIPFGRYAILPIAGENHVLLDEWRKTKLNEKRLKELYFEKDMLAGDGDPEGKARYEGATIYSGNGSGSVSHPFAGHFGYGTGRLRGKRIAGDDIHLNSAVRRDERGVSFNLLNYVFDIESRKLNEGIALLPLDLRKEDAEVLSRPDLDETIALLESREIRLIPVEELVFVLPETVNPATLHFLAWALSKGQDYIHSFGFLRLDGKTIAREQRQLSELGTRLLAEK
jgi:hypothetical protein